jgi:hypothetical protein
MILKEMRNLINFRQQVPTLLNNYYYHSVRAAPPFNASLQPAISGGKESNLSSCPT